MSRILIIFVLSCCAAAQSGISTAGGKSVAGGKVVLGSTGAAIAGPSTLTVDASCAGDKNTTTATSVACSSAMTVTAGDAIECAVSYPAASTYGHLTDNVNTGNYTFLNALHTDDFNFIKFTGYFENSLSGSVTPTFSYTTTGTHAQIECVAWKGAAPTFTMDSSVTQSAATTGTNPTSGSTLTPFGNGEAIFGAVVDAVTPTAGTNYTLISSNTLSKMWDEDWIQTTKTATNTPFTAASGAYINMMSAVAPNPNSGSCDVSGLVDWHGSTNGTTVTQALLEASALGNIAQPNSNDWGNGVWRWGWTTAGSTTGITFSSTNAVPLATTETCPFYTGVGAGTLGLSINTASVHGLDYAFDSDRPNTSIGICFQSDLTAATNGATNDLIAIWSDVTATGDFANAKLDSNGSQLQLNFEAATSVNTGPIITAGNPYWIELNYQQNGTHSMRVYNGCGANPTRLDDGSLHVAAAAGAGPANRILFADANLTAPTGHFFRYTSPLKVDFIYGNVLLP